MFLCNVFGGFAGRRIWVELGSSGLMIGFTLGDVCGVALGSKQREMLNVTSVSIYIYIYIHIRHFATSIIIYNTLRVNPHHVDIYLTVMYNIVLVSSFATFLKDSLTGNLVL